MILYSSLDQEPMRKCSPWSVPCASAFKRNSRRLTTARITSTYWRDW